jgi:PncC family amidohydrolase
LINVLAQKIITRAVEKRLSLALAESVTGGTIVAALTRVSGASKVLQCGIVAYSEHAKIHALSVLVEEIRKTHGYSIETALAMANHVRMRNIADIAISTTGCAGPEPCAVDFSVGRVLFGLSVRGIETQVFDMQFSGSRQEVIEQASIFALQKVLEVIESFPTT